MSESPSARDPATAGRRHLLSALYHIYLMCRHLPGLYDAIMMSGTKTESADR